MSDFEAHEAGRHARRALPGRDWSPEEAGRQDMLQRYLGAVAFAAHARTGTPPEAAEPAPPPEPEEPPAPPTALRVREVMTVPAVAVRGDMPFSEVARTLSRERLSALPVVDDEDHVIGVVSESDLLAKAAVLAAATRPGPLGRLRGHRLYEKSRGETADTLMTYPAVTVRPGDTVVDAAWTAARSRLRRLPVTDHLGRLVGVVSRAELLRALVRDDAEIREEAEARLRDELRLEPGDVRVTVENGVVTMSGRVPSALLAQLVDSVRAIDEVVDVVDHLTAVP